MKQLVVGEVPHDRPGKDEHTEAADDPCRAQVRPTRVGAARTDSATSHLPPSRPESCIGSRRTRTRYRCVITATSRSLAITLPPPVRRGREEDVVESRLIDLFLVHLRNQRALEEIWSH